MSDAPATTSGLTSPTETDDGLLSATAVADPHGYFAALRSREPVAWNERYRSWVLTRYDDNQSAVKDKRFSSDRITPAIDRERQRARPDQQLLTTLELLNGWMVFKDAPEHTRLRRLVFKAFTPRMIESMRGEVVAVADGLLTDVEREIAEGKQIDLLRSYAYPLPAIVIAGMLGVPADDRDRFKQWSDDISALVFGGLDDEGRHERARSGMSGLVGYITELVARARISPGDDLIGALIRAQEADDTLTNSEIIATCTLLLFGGHETTTNLIANAVLALLQNPDQAALLLERPDLAGQAVEEFLRYDGPAKVVVRVAAEDLELRGRIIMAGQRVFLAPSAANRDPEVFERPDELDIMRTDNPHIGFGMGMHYCLGATLARLEGSVAIPRVLERFPTLALGDEPLQWQPILLTRGLVRLPVRVAP
jgi:cytochrome P450